MFCVFETATGRILYSVDLQDNAVTDFQSALPSGQGMTAITTHPNGDVEYISEGEIVARPSLPPFSASYDLTALPAGTVLTITDESGTDHEITDLTDTLILEGPETFQVKVIPPFPHISIRTTIEVP